MTRGPPDVLARSCNNQCIFCERARDPELLRDAAVRAIVKARAITDRLVITGGDPTVRDDLVDLVVAARDAGYREVRLCTNGRRPASRSLAEALLAAGVTVFSPSLHGHVAALHDALTGVSGSFKETVAGIRNLVALGAPLELRTVIVRGNLRRLGAIVDFACALGVPRMALEYVRPTGTVARCFLEVVPAPGDVGRAVRAALARAGGRAVACVDAVPPCLVRGDERARPALRDAVLFDLCRAAPADPAEGRVHGPPCDRCAWRARCDGPWREVAGRFGWEAFVPLPAKA